MRSQLSVGLIAIGLALLLIGFFAIFSMVIGLIEKSYAVSFCAYGVSLIGLLLGLVGLGFPSQSD